LNPKNTQEYLKTARHIRGWFWPAAAHLFGMIDEIQKSAGITGNLFEIGTFHGKSTLLLAEMLDPATQVLGVCDLFGIEESHGAVTDPGFHDTFMQNIHTVFPSTDFLRTFIKPSTQLTIADTTTDCRFFHIDGDHEAQSVCHDLCIAADAAGPSGVVVLDDIYNFAWPGVAEGFFEFMRKRPNELVPLSIGFNKLVMCRPAARPLYAQWLADAPRCWQFIPRGPLNIKTSHLCGHEIFVFHIPSRRSPDHVRTALTMLHHHAPRMADRVSRLVRYHAAADAC
jgi:hypothetical protein